MKSLFFPISIFCTLLLFGCGGSGSSGSSDPKSLVVNSLEDTATPVEGQVTLRSAVEQIATGGTISFAPALDGETIELVIIGAEHSILKGEVMGFDYTENISFLIGYMERDYGKSALYARKNLVIDASGLAGGITVTWTGTDAARVLAVYGNLIMRNISITGGNSVAEEIDGYDPDADPGDTNSQPWTLGRGGAVAVWGEASLADCTIYDNRSEGDFEQSRDRGAFGGGIYADIVHISNCVISGNTVVGAGAAGGGVYTVGGADSRASTSTIEQSSITGNRISGVFTYGGGVYSDGGGIGNLKTLLVKNSTIARNLVEPPFSHIPPFLLPALLDLGYWRGGGLYMSNGYLSLLSSTVVENEVYGKPRTDSDIKPNLAGGIAATIGNAHAVENMIIRQSIITGNTVHELDNSGSLGVSYPSDIFTGSLLHFFSHGYNLVGSLNFDHMLAPIPQWESLSRRHWPASGDSSDVEITEVLDLQAVVTDPSIISRGVDAGNAVALRYMPVGAALDQVPEVDYTISFVIADITGFDFGQPTTINDFLPAVLLQLVANYPSWASDLFTTVGDPEGTLWYGPSKTWPTNTANTEWIDFWHDLDDAIGDNMGAEKLGDAFWKDFEFTSSTSGLMLNKRSVTRSVTPSSVDQLGNPRIGPGDIGAIEVDF
jgi:hypothetical protein